MIIVKRPRMQDLKLHLIIVKRPRMQDLILHLFMTKRAIQTTCGYKCKRNYIYRHSKTDKCIKQAIRQAEDEHK